MKQCPGCVRAARTSERIEPDLKKKGKYWLITYCAKCGFNYDIEEYTGEVLSPEDEMKKVKWPDNKQQKYWPGL